MTSPITALDAKKLAEANNSTLNKIYDEITKKANNGDFELTTDVSKEECWLIVNILKNSGYGVRTKDVFFYGDSRSVDPELTIQWIFS